MDVDWTFTAESYLDQLSRGERTKVLRAVEELPAAWSLLRGTRLNRLAGGADDLYAFQVGADLRVILRHQDGRLTVVDVVRRSQVEGLRRQANLQTVTG